MVVSAVPPGWAKDFGYFPVIAGQLLVDDDLVNATKQRIAQLDEMLNGLNPEDPDSEGFQQIMAARILHELGRIWELPRCTWKSLRKGLKDKERKAWEVWTWYFVQMNRGLSLVSDPSGHNQLPDEPQTMSEK